MIVRLTRTTGTDFARPIGHRPPVPRQQFVDAVSRMFGDARKDVGEPGRWIDIVHLGRDSRVYRIAAREENLDALVIFGLFPRCPIASRELGIIEAV
jgi:hypothetical protein